MDDCYEELKDKLMPCMLFPQWEGPVDYKTMAGDGVALNCQEDISTSESDSTSMEQAECIGTEQLQVSMCMYM